MTHSNAYVERYEEKKVVRHDGVAEVVLVAWVRRNGRIRRSADVMPAAIVNVSEFSRNLQAQIITRDKRDADAEDLLKDVFDEFDPISQFTAIPANGGVPLQLWNTTTRKTRAKANKIRSSAGQLRTYGMIVDKMIGDRRTHPRQMNFMV